MTGAPRSKQFDDVYFSAQGGLAETRHVFLKGNGLPDAWQRRKNFTIFETGFGTGLNFLAAARLFADTAKPEQTLNFISVEKFPLGRAEIEKALTRWHEEFGEIWPDFLANYPECLHEQINISIAENIFLTVLIGDAGEILTHMKAQIDAWFLDGFKPAANPEMWSDAIFQSMARLSRTGATFATFTAAGIVKRGLHAAGFEVEKIRGFGAKRDMLIGRLP